MTPDTPTAADIEEAAGTEDENGVIQPSVEEILAEDPEHADGDEGALDEDGSEEEA